MRGHEDAHAHAAGRARRTVGSGRDNHPLSGRWAARAAYHGVRPDNPPAPGALAHPVAFTRSGHRHRVTQAPTPATLPLRHDDGRPLRLLPASLAPPGLRRLPGVAGSRHPPHRLPRLPAGPHRADARGLARTPGTPATSRPSSAWLAQRMDKTSIARSLATGAAEPCQLGNTLTQASTDHRRDVPCRPI